MKYLKCKISMWQWENNSTLELLYTTSTEKKTISFNSGCVQCVQLTIHGTVFLFLIKCNFQTLSSLCRDKRHAIKYVYELTHEFIWKTVQSTQNKHIQQYISSHLRKNCTLFHQFNHFVSVWARAWYWEVKRKKTIGCFVCFSLHK